METENGVPTWTSVGVVVVADVACGLSSVQLRVGFAYELLQRMTDPYHFRAHDLLVWGRKSLGVGLGLVGGCRQVAWIETIGLIGRVGCQHVVLRKLSAFSLSDGG